MNCPSCGQENRHDAAFCMACGAPLPDVPFAQLDRKPGPAREGGDAHKTAPLPSGSRPVKETGMRLPTTPPPTPGVPPAPDMDTATAHPAVPRDAHGVDAGGSSAGSEALAHGSSVVEEVIRPRREQGREAVPPPPPLERPQYYIPPEADCVAEAPGKTAAFPQEARPAAAEKTALVSPADYMDTDKTQAISPAPPAPPPRLGRRPTVTCPECYAKNPEGNSFCQECGSPLSPVGARASVSARPAPSREGRQKTAVLPSAAMAEGAPGEAYKEKAARTAGKGFGVADVLAMTGVAAAGAALALSSSMESFSWKKGLHIGMFTHQGAFTQGRADLLGGPGILPYEGVEFLTVGLVAAVGIAMALIFLAARTGRGPMFILSGCFLLFPLAYLLFQALLPLRQTGIEIQPSLGIGALFSGGADNPGLGPPLWMISCSGALLILAGFIAPPRGWGRLFTFLAFFPAMAGLAFFCAACYNWNLFISAAGMPVAPAVCAEIMALPLARIAGMLPLLL